MTHQVVDRCLVGLEKALPHHPLGSLNGHRRVGCDLLGPGPGGLHELIVGHDFVDETDLLRGLGVENESPEEQLGRFRPADQAG